MLHTPIQTKKKIAAVILYAQYAEEDRADRGHLERPELALSSTGAMILDLLRYLNFLRNPLQKILRNLMRNNPHDKRPYQ